VAAATAACRACGILNADSVADRHCINVSCSSGSDGQRSTQVMLAQGALVLWAVTMLIWLGTGRVGVGRCFGGWTRSLNVRLSAVYVAVSSSAAASCLWCSMSSRATDRVAVLEVGRTWLVPGSMWCVAHHPVGTVAFVSSLGCGMLCVFVHYLPAHTHTDW
jgi:hypothetical protein